jgi:AraC-like DNA-binding protein
VSDRAITMEKTKNLLSTVPTGTIHRVQGTRTISFAGVAVDILATRKITLTEWSLRRFADPYWRLYWPLETGGVVEIEGRRTTLKPGRVYLIPPHTVFSTALRHPFTKWYAHFKLGRLADRAAPGIHDFPAPVAMRELITQMEKSGHRARPFPWLTIEFVMQALRLLPDKTWSQQRHDPRVLRALEFMSDHLTLKLTSDKVARHAGLSVRNLNHLFHQQLHQSPMRILLDYRLDEACRLLRTDETSIDQIAEDTGLQNRHYLSRMLRQYRGTSPAVYRREQQWKSI